MAKFTLFKGIDLWDVSTGKKIGQKLELHRQNATFSFSPDSKYMIIGSNEGTLILWDIIAGQPVGEPWQDNYAPESVAFSLNGKYVASGNANGEISLWNVSTAQRFNLLWKTNEGIDQLAFSPDGKYLISGGGGVRGPLTLWNIQTGHKQSQLRETYVRGVAFSPDSKYVVTASGGRGTGYLSLWDVSSGQLIRDSWSVSYEITNVTFSPDGMYVISGGYEGTLTVFEVNTGQSLGTLWKKMQRVDSNIIFSNDGKSILSLETDHSIKYRTINSKKMYEIICEKVSHNLAPQQWYKFFGENILPHQKSCDQYPLQQQ